MVCGRSYPQQTSSPLASVSVCVSISHLLCSWNPPPRNYNHQAGLIESEKLAVLRVHVAQHLKEYFALDLRQDRESYDEFMANVDTLSVAGHVLDADENNTNVVDDICTRFSKLLVEGDGADVVRACALYILELRACGWVKRASPAQ